MSDAIIRTSRVLENWSEGGIAFSPSPYIGPGDMVPGATAYLGLRAYSLAKCGTRAINIRNATTTAQQDFNTLGNGDLDVASIVTFLAGANGFVTALYDQTGNGNHATQATPASQPQMLFGIFQGRPVIRWLGGPFFLETAASFNPASQPFTISGVSRCTSAAQAYYAALWDAVNSGAACGWSAAGAAHDICGVPSKNVTGTIAQQFYAIQNVFTFTASTADLNVNGTQNTWNSSGATFGTANTLRLGELQDGTSAYQSDTMETALYMNKAFSQAESAAMAINQADYYGF